MQRNQEIELFVIASFKKIVIHTPLDGIVKPFVTSFPFSSFSMIGKKKERELLKKRHTLEVVNYLKEQGISSLSIVKIGSISLVDIFDFGLLQEHKINLKGIIDKTPIPHNGGRSSFRIKRRR